MDIKTIALWVCIIVFALPTFFFGFQKIKQDPQTLANFTRWGYSKLFMMGLGIAEIIIPIGFFFSQTRLYAVCIYGMIMLGAIYTHLKAKDKPTELIAPVFVLGLLVAIYFLN